MTAYRELIERLEEATGPDRVLDHDILLSLGWTAPPVYHIDRAEGGTWKVDDDGPDTFEPFLPDRYSAYWREPSGKIAADLPALTWSIDAALSLVEKMLPEWDMEVFRDREAGLVTVDVTDFRSSGGGSQFAQNASEPVATCLALLRALEAQSKDKEEGE